MPQAAVSIPLKSFGNDGREILPALSQTRSRVKRINMASLTGGADNDGIGKQFSSPSNVKNGDTDGARKRGDTRATPKIATTKIASQTLHHTKESQPHRSNCLPPMIFL